jgi:transposase InsO family protein
MRAQGYGVEPICAVLREQGCQVAPRTYRAWKKRAPSKRIITDAYVTDALLDTVDEPEGLYGRRKMTSHLRRSGHQVAACTVDRIMRDQGLNGAVRGRSHRTTIPANDAVRAGDRLNRDFTAACPNRVWVADFTYCRTWAGFVYVAFVIDVYSRMIVGWHVMTTKPVELVTVPIRMALWRRDHEGHPVRDGLTHRSDAGSQYTSIRLAEDLFIEGIAASIGSVGDAYDNALAESTIGLFKTEAIAKNNPFHSGPFKTIADIEYVTMGWVDWYNNRRLHSTLDNIPPAEFEANYYATNLASQPAMSHT